MCGCERAREREHVCIGLGVTCVHGCEREHVCVGKRVCACICLQV